MSKTKHLDTAIDILRGDNVSKRPKRKTMEIAVMGDPGAYSIQCNGRVLESGIADIGDALRRAEERAAAIRALGKRCTVVAY